MVLPLPWVLSELKPKNIWERLMAEDINPFLLVVLLSFIFQRLSPSSSSLFPSFSSFSSLYAVSSLSLLLFFLSLLPDSLKVTFEMHVTHTLMYECSKGTLCCRRHCRNSIDLNTSVLRRSPWLRPWGVRLNPFIWNCYLFSFWDFFFSDTVFPLPCCLLIYFQTSFVLQSCGLAIPVIPVLEEITNSAL